MMVTSFTDIGIELHADFSVSLTLGSERIAFRVNSFRPLRKNGGGEDVGRVTEKLFSIKTIDDMIGLSETSS